jgi:hypothetical protein
VRRDFVLDAVVRSHADRQSFAPDHPSSFCAAITRSDRPCKRGMTDRPPTARHSTPAETRPSRRTRTLHRTHRTPDRTQSCGRLRRPFQARLELGSRPGATSVRTTRRQPMKSTDEAGFLRRAYVGHSPHVEVRKSVGDRRRRLPRLGGNLVRPSRSARGAVRVHAFPSSVIDCRRRIAFDALKYNRAFGCNAKNAGESGTT